TLVPLLLPSPSHPPPPLFFSLRRRRPPCSTLFPYTTLFRSLFRPQDRAGRHGIDPHARGQFQRQRARGHLQRRLRRRIGRVLAQWPGGMHVGQVDDGPALAAQVRGGGLCEEERRARVDREQLVPLRRRHLPERRGEEVGGVVDQCVE